MAIIGEREKRQIQDVLKNLAHPVKIVYFTQELECPSCRETNQLLREFSALSERISLETYNFQLDREEASRYAIDKIPATVVMGEQDYGIRFYGAPLGYEFSSFLDAVIGVSGRDSGLMPATREKLATVDQPLHIQVLVTPT